MKKWKILLGLATSFVIVQTTAFAANECTKEPIYDNSCPSDSTFYGKLRFEEKYGLNDEFYARGGTNQILGLKYQIKEQCDYNNSDVEIQKDSNFFYTTEDLNGRKGVLPAREDPYRIITSNDYEIRKLPPKRDDHNLLVKYIVKYNVNGGQEKTHTECKYYAITWCGDGVVDKPGKDDKWEAEICDPADPNHVGWGDGGCDNTCKPVKKAVCSSDYNGKKLDTLTEGNHLCTEGTYSEFYEDKINHKWTWKCKNKLGNGVDCSATQPYCGDGNVDKGEQCDPKDSKKTNWGNGGCDEVSCTPIKVGDPVCNSKYNGQRLKDLTEGNSLCTEGTYSEFGYNSDLHKWTWKCKNKLGNGVDCSANKPFCGDGIPDEGEECDGSSDCSPECKKMYCGDGIRNNGEQCDPKDSTKAGRGPKGCNEFCEPEFDSDVSCTQTFKKTLRCGSTEKFPDDFKAGGTDRWMYDYNVTFEPEKGYNINGGLKPTFGWTQTLKNANMLVKAGQQMRIIEAEEAYLIKNCPKKRSYENLYMEYLVVSAGEDYAGKKLPNSKLSSHKECVYYEISWCGDGTLDAEYGEECDPGSAGTSVLPDGRICNSECKIESPKSPKGTAVIEKTLKDKIEVTHTGQELTWNVKVTASGGNVTNFEIWDKMPVELDYVNWELNKANTQNGIDVKYSNRKPNPKSSGEVNIHYWDVTGTLYSGNSITMSIKTKVNKMPGAGENIVNIACVIKDNKEIDCGGDEPPKTEGYLVPDKTIIGTKEVKSTGDIIKWSLKVYAKGGNVKDPVIQDVLPSVLGYSGYKITHNPGLSIYTPTIGTVVEGGVDVETIEWKVIGTLEKNDYIEIELTTYAKKMPEKDYDNVLCARPKDKPADKKCDKEPIPAPKLWIKKYIMDGTNKIKEKTVKIGDEIVYRIEFGNKGTASATITSIKDFLPKNVGYRSSEVYVGGTKVNTEVVENTQKGELTLITNKYKVVDGVRIDIFGGLTLKPDTEGYIIIKGEILTGNQNNRTNFACIYLNDKKPDNDIVDGERCDSVVHNFDTGVSCKPTLNPSSFASVNCSDTSKFETTVTCQSTGGVADIEIICDGNTIKTGHVAQLVGTCSANTNNTNHKVQCKINGSLIGANGEVCESSFKRDCTTPSSCFIAGTKVIMADGSQKNIENVKIGEKILGQNGSVNTVLGYDRPILGNRHLWSINGGEYFVSDEHPFKTTEGWKSFNPEMTKLEIDLNTTELKVGDILITKKGLEMVKTVDFIDADYNTPLYNFVLDGDHTYYANGYLVHNKNEPYCTKPKISGSERVKTVVCETDNGRSADIKIDCGYGNQVYTSKGKVTSLTGTCDYTNAGYGNYQILCYADDKNLSHCNDNVTYSSCFPEGTKVIMADGTKKNIEEVKEGDMVLSYNTDTNTNELSVVEQRIIHEDSEHEMYELTINGNVLKATDVHPFYVRKSVSSREYDWIEAKNLKVGDILLMKDGSLVEIERIEHYPNKETVYNLEVEGNHNYYVAEGYLVHNKGGGTNSGGGGHTPTQPIYNSTNCVDVNANQLSYEQGEVLAFYWNIKDLSGGVGEWAYEFTSPTKAYPATIDVASGIIKNKINQPCTGLDGRIALDSMVCYFEIKDPDGNVVAKKTAPCLQRENTPISPALLSGWMNAGIERITKTSDRGKTFYWSYHTKDTTGELRSNLNYITNFGVDLTKFGEYKVKLSKITYLQCKNEKWQDVYTGGNCENPFVLTNPYTVQKTPSGNLKASTEALSNYKYCEKYEKITSTNDIPKCLSWNTANNLLNAIAVSEYQPNDAVNGAMTKFINKYSKLAVKAGDGLKKVPGKNIYFVSSDICLGSQCEKSIDVSKPTTVVQTEGYNTKIKGNVNSNLMLLTKGKITFTDSKSCNNRQVVKGIFYAENGIERTRVTKNTSDRLNEAQRCTEGGLTVKGVLIGRGLDGVMKNSRSNLNKWFSGKNAQTVMNGASVIIEYSPSVFTKGTMPPGAEDFTTALSIYKD